MMKIKFSFSQAEMKEIIKAHVLRLYPINLETNHIYVTESYGKFTVEIEEKIAEEQKEAAS
jgi:hypothetical protein